MKTIIISVTITGLVLFAGLYGFAGTCAASPTNCPEKGCTATYTGNDGGGVQCWAEENEAHCESYDKDGIKIEEANPKCTSGGGGSGGGIGDVDGHCQIYWWECDPWAV